MGASCPGAPVCHASCHGHPCRLSSRQQKRRPQTHYYLQQGALALWLLAWRFERGQDGLIEHVLEALLGQRRAFNVLHGAQLPGELLCAFCGDGALLVLCQLHVSHKYKSKIGPSTNIEAVDVSRSILVCAAAAAHKLKLQIYPCQILVCATANCAREGGIGTLVVVPSQWLQSRRGDQRTCRPAETAS